MRQDCRSANETRAFSGCRLPGRKLGHKLGEIISGLRFARESQTVQVRMLKRCIAASICLLLLSVSTVFAALHKHDANAPGAHKQCAACLWHSETISDVPTIAQPIPAADFLLVAHQADSILPTITSVKVHPTRGPPALPL